MPTTHDLSHALNGCGCTMSQIYTCVICNNPLKPNRTHVDTCGEHCYKRLLKKQRGELERGVS